MGFLDSFLAAGSTFDWISPLIAIGNDIANGPGHTFALPRACGRTTRQVQQLLSRQNIYSWGLTIHQDQILITVHKANAAKAAHILERAGL